MSSGNIMSEIQALIAPPGDTQQVKVGLDLHPYFKRPGKGHNSDKCHSCGESGDLLCCDQCPASFHLLCHDPPISVEQLPEGNWICHRCKALEAIKLGASPIQLPEIRLSKSETDRESQLVRSPLEYLLQAASMLNPKEFDLPRELNPHEVMPEDSKYFIESSATSKRKCTESDRCPQVARLCHSCRKGPRTGVLIACDYCNAYFHMDCLDPPLATPPPAMSVWMCPLHVEHVVDARLDASARLTERVQLCNRFCGPLDQHAVKIDFLHKAAGWRRRLEERSERRAPASDIHVPDNVRYFYEHPVQIPDESALVLPPDDRDATQLSSGADRGLWLKAVLQLQLASAHHLQTHSLVELLQNAPSNDCDMAGDDERATPGDDTDCSNGGLVNQSEVERRALRMYACDRQRMAGSTDLHCLDESLVHVLAAERISQLVGGGLAALMAPQCRLDRLLAAGSLVAARAVLVPLRGYGATVEMRRRSLRVGLGGNCQLELSSHGACSHVSPQHATIFYDDETDEFEVLNYSEYGSRVDGVFLCNSLTCTRDMTGSDGEINVEAVIRSRTDAAASSHVDKMSAGSTLAASQCWCDRTNTDCDARGLETAALLHHGSVLQFGCLQFVFGVVEHLDSNAALGHINGDVLEALRKRAEDRESD